MISQTPIHREHEALQKLSEVSVHFAMKHCCLNGAAASAQGLAAQKPRASAVHGRPGIAPGAIHGGGRRIFQSRSLSQKVQVPHY